MAAGDTGSLAGDFQLVTERNSTSAIIEEIHRDDMSSNPSFFDQIDFNDVQRRKLTKIIVFAFVARGDNDDENGSNSNFNFSPTSENRGNNEK